MKNNITILILITFLIIGCSRDTYNGNVTNYNGSGNITNNYKTPKPGWVCIRDVKGSKELKKIIDDTNELLRTLSLPK